MNWEAVLNSKIVTDLGLTLLNSLWQIAALSAGLFLALKIFHHASARLRYGISVAALVIAFVLPVVTFVQISGMESGNTFADYTRNGRVFEDAASQRSGRAVELSTARADPSSTNFGATETGGLITKITAFLHRNLPQILPYLVGLWLIGIAFFTFRLSGGVWQIRRYKTVGIEPVDEFWRERLAHLSSRIGLNRPIQLVKSSIVDTPIAVGFFKPFVIVPASIFLQISPRELETIITHELIHIRRYDPLVNVLQSVIETVLFYHPGVWWISAQVRREREFAADAEVIELIEDSHVVYARALANLEEIRLRTNQQTPRYATAANGGNLMQRIQRILKRKPEMNRANFAWTAGLAVLLTSALLAILFSVSSTGFVNAEAKGGDKKLAIGFISIPPLDRSTNPPHDGDAVLRMLIDKLKIHKVPATGFLQGGMVSDGEKLFPVRANVAKMWAEAGFDIGLGGFKHINLYHTPVDDYLANIEKNERVAKQVFGDGARRIKYYSYPYLNAGKSVEDKAKVEEWLKGHGYAPVKYTFDNQEWVYSYAYDVARFDNDVNTMKEVRDGYLAYMTKMFDHYEAYSREMFGRDIAQTMVLTPSRLTTDTADEFFGIAAKRGYKFVTLDEAQSDLAYKTPENFVGKGGISWFERWTMAKAGKLRDEPEVDASIWRTWESRSKK